MQLPKTGDNSPLRIEIADAFSGGLGLKLRSGNAERFLYGTDGFAEERIKTENTLDRPGLTVVVGDTGVKVDSRIVS